MYTPQHRLPPTPHVHASVPGVYASSAGAYDFASTCITPLHPPALHFTYKYFGFIVLLCKTNKHIETLLNRLVFVSFAISTVTLMLLFLQTPETCVSHSAHPKPHHKFPKSTCDFTHRSVTSIDKKNKRLWSTKAWQKTVQSFEKLFKDLNKHNYFNNNSKVVCVSAGGGQEVMALQQPGVEDITGVELVDSPPLVKRADPHNSFFYEVIDLGFTAHLDQALFTRRFAGEMERTVKVGGVCVLAVEECGDKEVKDRVKLFEKETFISAKNVSLIGMKTTLIVLKIVFTH